MLTRIDDPFFLHFRHRISCSLSAQGHAGLSRPFLSPTPRRAVDLYWRYHPVRADKLARALAAFSGAPKGWAWRVGIQKSGPRVSFRAPPTPVSRTSLYEGPRPLLCVWAAHISVRLESSSEAPLSRNRRTADQECRGRSPRSLVQGLARSSRYTVACTACLLGRPEPAGHQSIRSRGEVRPRGG